MSDAHDAELRLLKLQFPNFTCICELCDCGRHVHHTNCKKMARRRQTSSKPEFPLTHSQDMFRAHTNVRPRSSKRPPPSPRDPNPPPMTFETQQRTEFKQRPMEMHKPHDHPKENFDKPSGAMETTTHYKQVFSAPPLESSVAAKAIFRGPSLQMSSVKFDDRTTAKEAFKEWKASPSTRFQELPSFTGSLLYPDSGPMPLSTARQAYSGAYQPRPPPAKAAPDNLRTGEGDADYLTTSHSVYKGLVGHRAEKVVHLQTLGPLQTKKALSSFETQSMADYNAKKVPKVKAIDPAKPTIQIAYDERQSFETEQRSIYKGHDAAANPVPKSFKRVPEIYKKSDEPFEGKTVTHIDFVQQPLENFLAIQRSPSSLVLGQSMPKFDDRTMNKEFFKNWGPSVPRRVRHGDMYEAHSYVPPADKFDGATTSGQTYVAKPMAATHSFKPVPQPINAQGRHDFTTVSQETYKTLPLPLCRAQLYLLQRDLMQKLKDQQEPEASREEPAKQLVAVD